MKLSFRRSGIIGLYLVATSIRVTLDVSEISPSLTLDDAAACLPKSNDVDVNSLWKAKERFRRFDNDISAICQRLHRLLQSTKIQIHDIKFQIISGLTLVTADKHIMDICMKSVYNDSNLQEWKCLNTTMCVCPPTPTAEITQFSVMSRNGYITIDMLEANNICIGLCGDSGYLCSELLQAISENQFTIYQRTYECPTECTSIDRDVALNITDAMTNAMTSAQEQETDYLRSRTGPSSLCITGIELKNANITFELYKGSDMLNARDLIDRLTIKIWRGYMQYNFTKDRLYISIGMTQSTVGYIEGQITYNMQYNNGFWDLNLNVPKVHIQTSRRIVEQIIVLFDFNIRWNEYEILYNTRDVIRFRYVAINDIAVRFKYFNSPTDYPGYKSMLRGKWKYAVKLLPHCDVSVTFPYTMIKYCYGWEELINAYIKEMIIDQRLHCVKKLIVGTAKRKLGILMGF
jgi:hypothetical protein